MAAAWLGLFGLCSPMVMGQDDRPNILLIMTDQQGYYALGYTGNDRIRTPNLDRLASEGACFEQAVTPCAVCVPARTAILTGRLLENTGIRNNGDAKETCNFPSFDELLVEDSYTSEYYGKFHSPANLAEIYSNPEQDGMDRLTRILEWEPLYKQYLKEVIEKRPLEQGELYENTFYGGGVPYTLSPIDRRYQYLPSGNIPKDELEQKKYGQGDVHGVLDLPPEHTITAVQGKEALEALDRLKDEQFILTCSFHCPHVPITPSEPYVSMYDRNNMIPPESIHDKGDNSPYPPKKLEDMYSDEELILDMIVNYYAFVTEIDDWVGKILDRLDRLGLTDNTLVIFVSDHGEMLGAHGLRGKFNFFEESVRVPLILKYPGKIAPGQRFDYPVSTLNIFPTVLDYAGIQGVPSDGYSLRDIMEGGRPRYDFAVSEWDWSNSRVPSIMIRTHDWKLMTTHREGGENVDVLIDLKNDPHEMNNLLGSNPDRFKYEEVVEELRDKLTGYLDEVGYPFTEGIATREMIRE